MAVTVYPAVRRGGLKGFMFIPLTVDRQSRKAVGPFDDEGQATAYGMRHYKQHGGFVLPVYSPRKS